jgi:FkbM family methyltransferase
MKDLLQKLFGDYGIFLLRKWKHALSGHGREEARRRQAFYAQFVRRGEVCFDVGANMGNRIGPLLKLGARVVAVEPQEQCLQQLRFRFGNRIRLVPMGLGAEEGMRMFRLANDPTLSSFSEEWITEVKKERFSAFTWDRPVPVRMTTLDRLIAEHGLPSFIKIDVEGYETEVLKGLSQPVKMISFEYTVPEQTARVTECLELIGKHHPGARCNYSVGESMEFALAQWLDIPAMKEVVSGEAFIRTGFGDVYVGQEPGATGGGR